MCSVTRRRVKLVHWFKVKEWSETRLPPIPTTIPHHSFIDWIMRLATESNETIIPWSDASSLEELDFADDLAVTATNFRQKT